MIVTFYIESRDFLTGMNIILCKLLNSIKVKVDDCGFSSLTKIGYMIILILKSNQITKNTKQLFMSYFIKKVIDLTIQSEYIT